MQNMTKAEFIEAVSADLAEAFELFIQQTAYFEVLNVTSGVIAQYQRFEQYSGEFCNMSAWFAHDGKEYAFQAAEREGHLTSNYYRFVDMDEARAFAAGLLLTVTEGV
ncbi:hypothetical protein EVB77_011 [Rhizobium phage RHph_N1_10]|nr:hypothetical protein EVB77_011 [Rhizobium phage RHph_N1_10]